MKFVIYGSIFEDDKLGVTKTLNRIPTLWEDLEADRTDEIVQKYIDGEINPKTAFRQLTRAYGSQSENAVQLAFLYGNVVDKSKLKSKNVTISIPIYLYDKLKAYKKEGGQMSQLVAALLDREFDVAADDSIKLQKFVNKWLNDRFRESDVVKKERQKEWEEKAAVDLANRKRRDQSREQRKTGMMAAQGVPMQHKRPTSTMDEEIKSDDDFKAQTHEEIIAMINKQRLHNSKVDSKDAKKKTKA